MKDDVLWMGEIEAVVNEVDQRINQSYIGKQCSTRCGPEEAGTTKVSKPFSK